MKFGHLLLGTGRKLAWLGPNPGNLNLFYNVTYPQILRSLEISLIGYKLDQVAGKSRTEKPCTCHEWGRGRLDQGSQWPNRV